MNNLVFVVFLCIVNSVLCSDGDRSPFYQNCMRACVSNNCTKDGRDFEDGRPQPLMEKALVWSCYDECGYHCMWRTTISFIARFETTPQFHGKWPFVRFLGLQEPASVFFSLANLVAHVVMLRKMRMEVRHDSPLYWVWHFFAVISLNGWTWSIVFHARDFPITELFDYGFAYSMVLASFYCMVMRFIYNKSIVVKGLFGIVCMMFFVNHFAYLSTGMFDYKYNMEANIITGTLAGGGWIFWFASHCKHRPYAWKIVLFQILVALSLMLELNDFAPIWWTFDAHSLWHLSTVPLAILFYDFAIQDCKALRHEKYGDSEDKEKFF